MAHTPGDPCARARFSGSGRATAPPGEPSPAAAWTHIALGYVSDMPPVTAPDGQLYCGVVTFIDLLSRQARFLPAPETLAASQVAALFSAHVPLQGRVGPPKALVWDRDPEPPLSDSELQFWRQLCALLQVPVAALPQAAEADNACSADCGGGGGCCRHSGRRVVEQFLRAHAHHLPDDWAAFLPLAEAAFNGTPHIALGAAPFLVRASSLQQQRQHQQQQLQQQQHRHRDHHRHHHHHHHPASAPASPRGCKELLASFSSWPFSSSLSSFSSASSSFSSSFSSSGTAVRQPQVHEIHVRAQMELQAARARYGTYGSRRCTECTSNGTTIAMTAIANTNTSCTSSSSDGDSSCSSSLDGGSASSDGSGAVDAPVGACCICAGDARFRPGDRVRLSTTNLFLPDQPDARLRPGFLGPFTISAVVSSAAYRLDLPPALGRLHPVFHVSRLMPWTEPPSSVKTLAAAAGGGNVSPMPARPAARDPDVNGAGPAAGVAAAAASSSFCSGDVVLGVRLGQVGRAMPTVLFHIRRGTRWPGGQQQQPQEGWEPYGAVERLPAVRAYLRTSEWREWRRSEAAQLFNARWPDRMPRLVRFEV